MSSTETATPVYRQSDAEDDAAGLVFIMMVKKHQVR